MGKRIHETPAEKLGTYYTCNERVSKENEMIVQQKEMKPTRTEGWRPCVARKQNIHLNQPLKKLDNKRYGLFKISKDIGSEAFELKLPEG